MTQLNNPSMSYAELTLPLPCSKELWFARTADEFKIRYLESVTPENNKPLPSLDDLFRDINTLSAHHHRLDVQLAISIYLHGFWSLIWELRQLSSIHSPTFSISANNNTQLLLASRHADLVSSLKSFQSLTRDWHEMLLSAQESLLLHLLLLNLHVSLPDLQLFSGREGEEQARRVYPALKRWGQGADARVALWHAAQILRMGRGFPRGHLKDFWSVAVCHAGLAIWAWGVVMGAGVRQQPGGERQREDRRGPVVYLDGEETADVQAWVSYGQGQPAIHGLDAAGGGEGQGGGSAAECLLEDPRACMEAAQEILRANFVGVWETLPPLSENIIAVLKQLEKAAWAVGMG